MGVRSKNTNSLDTMHLTEMKGASRKALKPLMEKKRRARMNACLDQLKSILKADNDFQNRIHDRTEKADILDMTVQYVRRSLTDKTNSSSDIINCTKSLKTSFTLDPERGEIMLKKNAPPIKTAKTENHHDTMIPSKPLDQEAILTQFKHGFIRCLSEISRFIASPENPMDIHMKISFLTFLKSKLQNIEHETSIEKILKNSSLNEPILNRQFSSHPTEFPPQFSPSKLMQQPKQEPVSPIIPSVNCSSNVLQEISNNLPLSSRFILPESPLSSNISDSSIKSDNISSSPSSLNSDHYSPNSSFLRNNIETNIANFFPTNLTAEFMKNNDTSNLINNPFLYSPALSDNNSCLPHFQKDINNNDIAPTNIPERNNLDLPLTPECDKMSASIINDHIFVQLGSYCYFVPLSEVGQKKMLSSGLFEHQSKDSYWRPW